MSPNGIRLQPRAVILKPQQGPWLPDSLCLPPPPPTAGLCTAPILLHGLGKFRLMPQRPRAPSSLDFMRSDLQSHFKSALGYGGHRGSNSTGCSPRSPCWASEAELAISLHRASLRPPFGILTFYTGFVFLAFF